MGGAIFGCSVPYVVISTTEPTMIVAAIIIRDVIGSLANNQPNNTATTGLTYAYVAARAAVTLRNNQLYAVNATSEPNTVR